MKALLCSLLAVSLLMVAGFSMAAEEPSGESAPEKAMLCGMCGHIKGADLRCKADTPK